MIILGIDPSGSFKEGKGTTGLCVLEHPSRIVLSSPMISAKKFTTAEDYWQAHIIYLDATLNKQPDFVVSMEDFRLYGSKAQSLTNSSMETSQLIGVIRMWCAMNKVTLKMRMAAAVKNRWSNKILEHKGYIHKVGRGWANQLDEPVVSHTLDAMRHALHTSYFEMEE